MMKNVRLEIVFLLVLFSFVAGSYLLCSCSRKPVMEGFRQAGAAGLDYMMCKGVPGDTWGGCNKNGLEENKPVEGSTGEKADTDLESMLIFANNRISPDCCPSDASSYKGCVCITEEQKRYLGTRGGNQTINTEI